MKRALNRISWRPNIKRETITDCFFIIVCLSSAHIFNIFSANHVKVNAGEFQHVWSFIYFHQVCTIVGGHPLLSPNPYQANSCTPEWPHHVEERYFIECWFACHHSFVVLFRYVTFSSWTTKLLSPPAHTVSHTLCALFTARHGKYIVSKLFRTRSNF